MAQNRVFLDHARVAPIPRRAREAVEAFTRDACEHGTAHYDEWMAHAERVRERFARLVHAEPGEIAFVKNTSEGLSLVAEGLDWKPGDNVVVPDIEFPSNVYPWWNLKPRGVETRFVRSVDGRVPFDDLVKQTDDRTRLVSVSSVEFHSGFRNDLNRIGAFCKDRGILFCVDAIQSLGCLPMDVKRDGIDFLAADGHKWLLSVEGLGGFYVSKDALEHLRPVLVGWDSVVDAHNFLDYDFTLRPDARRFEEGSFNVMSLYALGASIGLLQEIGIDIIEDRVLGLGDRLLEEVRRRNLTLFSSPRPDERSGIVSFDLPADPDAFKTYMADHRVTLTVRGSRVRLSPHAYNNEDDLGRFFDLFDRFLNGPG